jgi:hypothetical protein
MMSANYQRLGGAEETSDESSKPVIMRDPSL